MSFSPSSEWCTIESDPEWGVKGVQVEEIYSLDYDFIKSQFQDLKIYGFIFLFKWDSEIQNLPLLPLPSSNNEMIKEGNGEKEMDKDGNSFPIYFAKQIVQNACATQAILSILMNIQEQKVKNGKLDCHSNHDKKDCEINSLDLGPELKNLKEFSMNLPSDLCGMAIGNCERIKQVHNSFSKPEGIYTMDLAKDSTYSEDPFHFISLVPINGHVYEFDGLKQGPIDHGIISHNTNNQNEIGNKNENDSDWIGNALKILQNKINLFGNREIRFNLMALTGDKMIYLRNLADEQIRQTCLSDNIAHFKIDDIERMIEEEQEKRNQYRKENKWRRVNFIPVIMELLELMAKDGLLNSYV